MVPARTPLLPTQLRRQLMRRQRIEVSVFQPPDLARIHPAMTQGRAVELDTFACIHRGLPVQRDVVSEAARASAPARSSRRPGSSAWAGHAG